MSEWRELKLADLGTLQRGRSRHRPRYAFHLYGGKYPFVQTGEVRTARKYIKEYEQTYSEIGLEQSKLWPKDTLCITIAANIAELAILSFDACFPDSILGFIPNEDKADLDFIYYTLTHFQRELKHIGEGSVQDNINLGTFQDILFPIPPLPEQKAIASVLSSLDDKIDLLHRQNKTLEAMAETLFRQWFVEEAEIQSENQLTLGELIESVSITHRLQTDTIIFLNTSDIYKGNVLNNSQVNVNSLPGQAKKSIQRNDILFSEIRPANGRWAYIHFDAEDYVVSTKLMVLRSKGFLSQAFVYFFLTNSQTVDWLQLLAESRSGTFPQITFDQLKDLKINIPSKSILSNSIEWCESALKKINSNSTQIRTLETLRDTLLPKLMSGEVRVDYP